MGKSSQLFSANGIILSEKYIIHNNEFDKLFDKICTLFNQQIIIPLSQNVVTGKRVSMKRHFHTIRIILSCLYYEWSHSTHGNHTCVRYYRNEKEYEGKKYLSYTMTLRVIDWLESQNYIECTRGCYYRNTKKGKMSRIRPKPKLSTMFHKIQRPTFVFDSHIDVIKLRDSNKKGGDEPTPLSEVVDSIKSHNSNISNLEKQREINRVRINHRIDLANNKSYVITPLHRVFNNSALSQGGRFYGSAEQGLAKSIRKKIHIDSQPTVERDFKNLHIKMLYDLSGIPLKSDSYIIEFKPTLNYNRSLIKESVMILLNASTEVIARKAIQRVLTKSMFKGIYSARHIIRDIKNHHHAISKYFGSGEGIRLQAIDSEIALEVMYHFAVNDIPCLCIHDSFIVDKRYKDELDDVMKAKYSEVMKFKQFRMLTSGKKSPSEIKQPLWNVHWNDFLRLQTNGSFSVGVD